MGNPNAGFPCYPEVERSYKMFYEPKWSKAKILFGFLLVSENKCNVGLS